MFFLAEIACAMKGNWLKKDFINATHHPSCSSFSDLIIILHDLNSF